MYFQYMGVCACVTYLNNVKKKGFNGFYFIGITMLRNQNSFYQDIRKYSTFYIDNKTLLF